MLQPGHPACLPPLTPPPPPPSTLFSTLDWHFVHILGKTIVFCFKKSITEWKKKFHYFRRFLSFLLICHIIFLRNSGACLLVVYATATKLSPTTSPYIYRDWNLKVMWWDSLDRKGNNKRYLLFTWENRKFRLEILFRTLRPTQAVIWDDVIFLLFLACSADLEILCSVSFSHHVSFYSFMFKYTRFSPRWIV